MQVCSLRLWSVHVYPLNLSGGAEGGEAGRTDSSVDRGRDESTDVKSRLAFTRPRCLAADLELASVDFATVEVEFELNRSHVGSK